MNVAIVDDHAPDRQALLAFLQQYCLQAHIAITCTEFPSGADFLHHFTPAHFPLVFFDIYMDGINGMDTARQVCQLDPNCQMIFVTTSHTDAVTSYEVRAAWYLTKPLDYTRFSMAMDRVCKSLLQDHQCIPLHQGGVSLNILLRDILWADCQEGRVCVHLPHRTITVDEKVSGSIDILAGYDQFSPCNRNVVVNMDRVSRIVDGNFLLENGQRVPIRLRGQSAVKKEYLRYSLRHLREEASL